MLKKEDNLYCCVSLVVPMSLEDNIAELLMDHDSITEAFYSDIEDGHNVAITRLSHNERVRGRQQCVHFKVILEHSHSHELINVIKKQFKNAGIIYWISDLHEVGTI